MAVNPKTIADEVLQVLTPESTADAVKPYVEGLETDEKMSVAKELLTRIAGVRERVHAHFGEGSSGEGSSDRDLLIARNSLNLAKAVVLACCSSDIDTRNLLLSTLTEPQRRLLFEHSPIRDGTFDGNWQSLVPHGGKGAIGTLPS